MAGQDAAPPGVVRSCAPGRILRVKTLIMPVTNRAGSVRGPLKPERKSRVARRLARNYKFSACSARHTPRVGGTGKETGLPRPRQVRDRQSVGFFCVGLFDN